MGPLPAESFCQLSGSNTSSSSSSPRSDNEGGDDTNEDQQPRVWAHNPYSTEGISLIKPFGFPVAEGCTTANCTLIEQGQMEEPKKGRQREAADVRVRIAASFTELELWEVFSRFGSARRIKVEGKKGRRDDRGLFVPVQIASIWYHSPESAREAKSAMHGTTERGSLVLAFLEKELLAKEGEPEEGLEVDRGWPLESRIYTSFKLPEASLKEWSDAHDSTLIADAVEGVLFDIFSTYGEVTHIHRVGRNSAYIKFASKKEAYSAVNNSMDNFEGLTTVLMASDQRPKI